MNIKTEKAYIGWYAYDDDTYDGPGSPIGYGDTREEALDDLIEQTSEAARPLTATERLIGDLNRVWELKQ